MSKILYIENEPEIAELVRRWLEEEDHQMVHAIDGETGFNLACSESPDLILLDINLGEFSPDGWEINHRLKDHPETRSIPVLALTAHAQWVECRDRALREGFVEHVSKPFKYELFLEKVVHHLKSGASG